MFGTDWQQVEKKVFELFAPENNKLTQKTWENGSTRAFPPRLVTKDYDVCLHRVSLSGFCLKHCPFSHPVSSAMTGVFSDLPKHFPASDNIFGCKLVAIFSSSSNHAHLSHINFYFSCYIPLCEAIYKLHSLKLLMSGWRCQCASLDFKSKVGDDKWMHFD